MNNFEYLIDKIANARFSDHPFPHIYIENFFNEADFNEITSSSAINIKESDDNEEMFNSLFSEGYKIIDFPGCIVDQQEYIAWHASSKKHSNIHTATEGFGMTLRLMNPKIDALKNLKEFIESQSFSEAIAKKFNIEIDSVYADNGIQKYLDGYEISPHPDIRKKALTYMININPHKNSHELSHHTHYLSLKDEYKYVESFWRGNVHYERCWVPWDWCEIEFTQSANNSLVMFSPNNSTIHAVKADYNHLSSQRTQLYGNLWYNKSNVLKTLEWENFQITQQHKNFEIPVASKLKAMIPPSIKNILKHISDKKNNKNYDNVRSKSIDDI